MHTSSILLVLCVPKLGTQGLEVMADVPAWNPHVTSCMATQPYWSSLLGTWGSHSLAVQEVHDGLQDVVSILCHAAAGAGGDIAGALHLAQDVPHLLNAFLDVGLEAEDGSGQGGQFSPIGPPAWPRSSDPMPPHLVANTRLSSSRTLLSFTCSSFRMSLASVSSLGGGHNLGQTSDPPSPTLGVLYVPHIHPWARSGAVPWGNPCRNEELGATSRRKAPSPPHAPHPDTPTTHLLPPHGLKHLLQLDAELLDVVHQDAGL